MKLLSTQQGRVLVLKISNPEARNAMWPGLYDEALTIVRSAADDGGIGAIVIAGDGEHFCGGGDLARLHAQRERTPDSQRANLDAFHRLIVAVHECPKVILAAVEGAAAGGGFSLCLACDLIVAAEKARFVMSYVAVGLSPDGGGSHALANMLPLQAATELLIGGGAMPSSRLHDFGVVNRIVRDGTAVEEAIAWADRLARGPVGTQGRIKRLIRAARGRSLQQQLDAESDSFLTSLYSDEAGRGIQAFLEKRKPTFN